MRYHTTFKDIAVSILLVLACIGICLYGMLFFSVINPAQPFADFLISKLDHGSSLSFRAKGLERSFFKEIELKEVSITLDDKTPFFSDSVLVDRGIGELLFSFIGKAKPITITLDKPVIDISVDQIKSFSKKGATDGSTVLSSWLDRNSIGLNTTSLSMTLTGPSYTASIQEADLALSLASGLEFTSFKGSIKQAQATMEQGSVHLEDILMDMDSSFMVNAEAGRGNLSFAGSNVQYEQLALAVQLPSLDVSKGTLGLNFSLANLNVSHTSIVASIPKLSSHLTLVDFAFSTLEASYDLLDLQVDDFVVHAPTSTINIKQVDKSLLFGFATKAGSPLSVQKSGYSPLLTDTLVGSAQMDEDGGIFAKLTMRELQTRLGLTLFDLEQVQISSEAFLSSEGIGNLSLSLESDATVVFGEADITLATPLYASLGFSDNFSTLSSSLSLSEISSNLVDEPLSGSLAYQQNLEGGQFQATFSYKNQLLLNALYDLPKGEKGTFSIQGRMQDFALALARPTLERYAPFFKPYYSDSTRLTGNLSFQSMQGTGTILGFDGTLSSDLVLLDVSLGNRILNAGFTVLAGIEGDSVLVDSLSLSTSDYRLAYSGSTELNYWLPSGDLQLFDTEEGTLLVSANFSPLPPNEYRYSLTTPLVPSMKLEGSIAREGLKNLIGKADFSLYGQSYPLGFTFFTPTLQLELESNDNLKLEANLAPPYQATLTARALGLPPKSIFTRAFVDGDFFLHFNDLEDWKLEAKDFRLGSMLLQGKEYALTGSLLALPSLIQSSELILSDGTSTFEISLNYKGSELLKTFRSSGLEPFTFTFSVAEETIPKISLSLIGSISRVETLLEFKDVGLERFFPYLQKADLNLILFGYTDFKKSVSMDGGLSLVSPKLSFASELSITDTQLNIENGSLQQGDLFFNDFTLSLDADRGSLFTKGTFNHIRTVAYTQQASHFNLSLSMPFTPIDSLFEFGNVLRDLPEQGVLGNISLDDLLILGEKGIADGNYSFNYKGKVLTLSSALLSLRYDTVDGSLEARLSPDFGIGITLGGWIRPDSLYLKAEDIYFPLTMLNRTFPKPVFSFNDGIAQGEVIVGGTLAKPIVYGQLSLDSAAMNLFWLPEDILSVRNATVSIDGQRGTTPTFPFFSTNKETGVTVRGVASLRADFDGLSLASYEIDARTTEGQVFVYLPIQGIDAEVSTYAEGTFKLFGVGLQTWLSGVDKMENTILSLGIRELPSWYVPTGLASTDFKITTGKNVTFYYPNTLNPFIKATLTENQTIDILFDHTTGEIALDGTFSFRSGEIYYFQKNFFITEGSLNLHTDALSGSSTIVPKINLRAKLTDFDRQGNRVDIFLILRDSSLTNLNPQFESVPNKDINEIFEIMGQSILPTGAYGQVNLYSVASLAAAATDVAGKLGYLTTANNSALTESIRISLGLDLFSLRSNIVQNILFDALPGSTLGASFSPLARYLNNTTIFMGKYVGEDYFLRALIHLSATDRSKIKRAFVAPDLAIDLELSLEWNNPLGTFSFFTQPNELSIYNIFDTIGFSVTKRIVLR